MNGAQGRAVLFDIDGTLLSTGGAGARAWSRAFEELHGRGVDIDAISETGMTDPQVGRSALESVLGREPTPAELSQVLAAYLKHLSDTVAESEGYRVLPGVPALLDHLVDAGFLLGLTTGGLEAAAHIKLARGNLNRFFSFGGYGSDSADRAELTKRALERGTLVSGGVLDRGASLAVGDTPRDVAAAHAAGLAVVGVATGKFTVEQLREAGADHVVTTLEEGLPL